MRIFDQTLTLLERSLDARLQRQTVLSGNLANADTPGYVPLEVDVDAALDAPERAGPPAGEGSATRPPSAGPAPIIDAPGATPGPDGNAVDFDRTLANLAQNALQYGAATRAAGKKLAILRYVASDGAA